MYPSQRRECLWKRLVTTSREEHRIVPAVCSVWRPSSCHHAAFIQVVSLLFHPGQKKKKSNLVCIRVGQYSESCLNPPLCKQFSWFTFIWRSSSQVRKPVFPAQTAEFSRGSQMFWSPSIYPKTRNFEMKADHHLNIGTYCKANGSGASKPWFSTSHIFPVPSNTSALEVNWSVSVTLLHIKDFNKTALEGRN